MAPNPIDNSRTQQSATKIIRGAATPLQLTRLARFRKSASKQCPKTPVVERTAEEHAQRLGQYSAMKIFQDSKYSSKKPRGQCLPKSAWTPRQQGISTKGEWSISDGQSEERIASPPMKRRKLVQGDSEHSSGSQQSESVENCLRRVRQSTKLPEVTSLQDVAIHATPVDNQAASSDVENEQDDKPVQIIGVDQECVPDQRIKVGDRVPDGGDMNSPCRSVLSENEREILNIGRNPQPTAYPNQQRTESLNDLKLSNVSGEITSPFESALGNVSSQDYDGHDEDDHVKHRASKKRRSSAGRETRANTGRNAFSPTSTEKRKNQYIKGKQKIPRTLPTEGLVCVEELLNYSDSDSDEYPLELPDDPISQLTDILNRSVRGKKKRSVKVKIVPRKLTTDFNSDRFRMPSVPKLSPRSRRRRQRETYGDGFDADEAQPIGKTTSAKRPRNTPTNFFTLKTTGSKLTMVPYKTSEDYSDGSSRVKRTKSEKQRKPPLDDNHIYQAMGETLLAAQFENNEPLGKQEKAIPVSAPQSNTLTTPKLIDQGQTCLPTPHTSTSPSKKKEPTLPHQRKVTFVDENVTQDISQPPNHEQYSKRPRGELKDLQIVAATLQTPKRRKTSEVTVEQELAMVSINKTQCDADSENDSEYGYIREEDTDSEECSDEDEETEEDALISDDEGYDKNEQNGENECVGEDVHMGDNDQERNCMMTDRLGQVGQTVPREEGSEPAAEFIREEILWHVVVDEHGAGTEGDCGQYALKRESEQANRKPKPKPQSNVPFSQRITQQSETQKPVNSSPTVTEGRQTGIESRDESGPSARTHETKVVAPNSSIPSRVMSLKPRRTETQLYFAYQAADDDVFQPQNWTLQQPTSSTILMEVGEEIVGSPTPLYPRSRNHSGFVSHSIQRQSSMKAHPIGSFRRQTAMTPLTISRTRRESPPADLSRPPLGQRQGSIELGMSQDFGDTQPTEVNTSQVTGNLRHSQTLARDPTPFVPETQELGSPEQHEVEQWTPKSEVRSSQHEYEPPNSAVYDRGSYIDMARKVSQLPMHGFKNLQRRKSSHASTYLHNQNQAQSVGVAAFDHTATSSSPVIPMPNSSSRPPSTRKGQPKSLMHITRQASQNMGTMSLHGIPHLLTGSARKR